MIRDLTYMPNVGDARVFVRDVGPDDGTVVLALHPEPGDGRLFEGLVSRIAPDVRCIVPDLRGHGRSGKPRGDYSVPTQTEAVVRVLDSLSIEKAVWLGCSYGGILSIYAAIHFPDRVAGLMPTGTNAFGGFKLPPAARLLASKAGRFLRPAVTRTLLARSYREQYAQPDRCPPSRIDHLYGEFSSPDSYWTMWRQANQIDWGISEARLGEIAAPTHIVWGRQDTATPPEDAARMMACIPGATLRVIDDCGHYPPIERPDAFAPEVLTMIQRLAGASAG